MPKPPHVLLLLGDQLRADRIGVIDPQAYTPHLDALAAEGAHCSNALSNHPQCAPARACLMTGRPSHDCGVLTLRGFGGHHNRIALDQPLLGTCFRDAGYRTVYFGKSHLYHPLRALGFDEGWASDGVELDDDAAERLGLLHVPAELRRDYLAHRHACRWLEEYQDDGRPLFFVFSSNLPHPPFFAEPRFRARFDDQQLSLPPSYGHEDFAGKPAFQRAHAHDGRHGALDEAAQRRELGDYYSMIAQMDEHFGDVIGRFKRLGLWSHTVAACTADHGEMIGAHGMRLKGTLAYDDLLRIPLLVKLPAAVPLPPARIDALVELAELPATLLQAAGLAAPEHVRRGDLFPALSGGATRPRAAQRVFFEHYQAYWGLHPLRGMRTRDWKYVCYYGEDDCEELYRLADDPDELCKLAGDPAHASVRAQMSAATERWWRATGGRDVAYYESDAFRANRHNEPAAAVDG